MPTRGSIEKEELFVTVEKTKYYGGAYAALIFRMDDFVVDPLFSRNIPDNFLKPSKYFENYQNQIIKYIINKYPWLRPTIGVITGCWSDNCSSFWNTYYMLAKEYGWEIASHSRYHTLSPRTINDYLGSINDIETHLKGYIVLTYIEPYGKTNDQEITNLYDNGIKIVCDSLPSLAFPIEFEKNEKVHFTVKASKNIPWKLWLKANIALSLATEGTIVFYTHPTSYDWDDAGQLKNAISYLVNLTKGKNFWYTTLRDLYLYVLTNKETNVSYVGKNNVLYINLRVTGIKKNNSSLPITLQLTLNKNANPIIILDGKQLKKISKPEYISKPIEGYWIQGKKIIINVKPPATIQVKFAQSIKVSATLPDYLQKLQKTSWKMKELSYLIWGGIIVKGIMVYRKKRRIGKEKEADIIRKKDITYSVIIPSRNSSETILDVLSTVINQSIKPRLITIVDDNSHDESMVVIKSHLVYLGAKNTGYLFKDNYRGEIYTLPNDIKVLLLQSIRHLGKALNVNNAIKITDKIEKTEYLLILDSDTLLERKYVEKIIGKMLNDESIAAGNGVVLLWKPDKKGIISNIIASAFRNIGGTIFMLGLRTIESMSGSLGSLNGAALIIRRSVLDQIGGIPLSLAEDTELTWKLSLYNYKSILHTSAFSYTIDPGSLKKLFQKATRISIGVFEAALKIFPEALRKKKFDLLFTVSYNVLGGIPIILSIVHFFLTIPLILLGIYSHGFPYRLALLFPYTPLSLGLLTIITKPWIYILMIYFLSITEVSLMLLVLPYVYRNNKAAIEARKSIKYVLFFPIILWLNAIAVVYAFIKVVQRGIKKDRTVMW